MENSKEAVNKELKLLSKDIRDVAKEKNKVTANNIIKVLPDQARFITSNSPEVLMAGGIASGKSVALCISLIQKALVPGAVCILTRKTLTDLKASTLRLLLEPEGTRPPLLPKGTYEWNKTDRIIEIRGGGIIYYTGCDDPMKIRSINASDIFIDEVSQLDENEFNELKMRLRVNVGSLQIKAVTNPANKSHWLYKRFVLNKTEEREMIYANSLNNIYLPKRTLDHLHNLKGETFDKMVLGQWLSQEKIIYKQFNPQYHVKDFNWKDMVKDFEDFFISIDVGWTNASALLLVGLHKNGKIYVCDEFEKPHQLIGKLGYQLSRWIKDCGDANIICDPAAAQVINELCAKGFNVKKAPNEVNSGISLVQSAFEENVLVISSSCVDLIREIEGYSRDDFGKIIKEDDHLVDALRYNISYLSLRGASQLKEIASFALPDIVDANITSKKDEEWSNIYE